MLPVKTEFLPPKLLKKKILSKFFIIFLFPTIADIGIPFAMALPKQEISGVTL